MGDNQGYENDHQDINILRLRNYTIGKKLSDDEVIGAKGLDHIAEQMSCMVPFVSISLFYFNPGQVMARVYGRGKGTEDRFTGIPRHAGSTDPSMLAFGALAVQPSNGAILDPAPASFGRGKLANSAGSRAGYMQELRKWSLTEARSADHISQQRRHARRRGRHVERVQRRGGGEREQRSGGGGGLSRHARVAAQRASKYDLSPLSPRHSRFLGPGGGAEAGKVAAVSMQPNHGSWSRWPSRRWVVSAQCQTVPESARPCQAVPGRARPHQRSRGPAGL
ncbi:hypothetical protein AOQ84DRAFT_358023, partial [Glonium stellatum]